MNYVLIAIWISSSMGYVRSDEWYETSMQEFSTIENCRAAKDFIKENQKLRGTRKINLEWVKK